MKIAFITSCLESGRDGVGDYTTLLAAECARQEHETRLVALNDPHLDGWEETGNSLRLSSTMSWPERVKMAREFVSLFTPDFTSIQFVCYGFHPRGIDLQLASRFREITWGIPVHIMFHELWIGAEKGARLKDRIVGALQRFCLLRIIRSTGARVIHTNTPAYAALLRVRGIKASTLPLFGSVPQPALEIVPRERGDTFVFGMFGTLHPVWPPEPLFSLLLSAGKKVVIAHIGRLGGAGESLWEKMTEDYSWKIEFRRLGEQAPEKIAEFFCREIDFGIATTPWELAGKSATVASMLEHGIPVIVNRDDWHIDVPIDLAPVSPLLVKMDESLITRLSTMPGGEPASLLPEVAVQFLRDLAAVS